MSKMGQMIRVPASYCPFCNGLLNGAACTDGDHEPKVGDVTVCTFCAAILEFGDGLKLYKVTPATLDSVGANGRRRLARQQAEVTRHHGVQ